MTDVVEKFEQVYAKIGAEQDAREGEADLAARASDVFFDRVASSSHDTRAVHPEPAMTGAQPAASASAADVDRFELPHTEVLPPAEPRYVAPASRSPLPARASRSSRAAAIAGICVALVVGTAIGFLMSPNREPVAARTQIEASDYGGTRLRLDYSLPKR